MTFFTPQALPKTPKPQKHLGQHWLMDTAVIQAIAHAACEPRSPQPPHTWLEIGPGAGALTEALLAQLPTPQSPLMAVELDRRSVATLQQRWGNEGQSPDERLQVIHGDILRQSPEHLAKQRPTPIPLGSLSVVGNLPYQITAPIVLHFLGDAAQPSPWLPYVAALTLMVQQEVADRLMAQPGTKAYSPLSLAVQGLCDIHPVLMHIGPKAFKPPPKVDSAVIQLIPKATPAWHGVDGVLFQRLVRTAFNQRRKTLLNSLGSLIPKATLQNLNAPQGSPPQWLTLRADALGLEAYLALTQALQPWWTTHTKG
ncbi:MAG: 16S rRNA (adenine(1518)-N(6)/adenine(1519)-N(6))-dimethyltransferase RsmA [Vampirovibrionales bacterium]